MATSTRGAALPSNPVLGAKGGGALPDNPLFAAKAKPAPSPAAPLTHHLAPGGLEQLEAKTRAASAPAVAQYNRVSGGTQGFVPGMTARDLGLIHGLNAQRPDLANVVSGLTNPIDWAVGAVHGAQQLGHGVTEAAHGKLGSGAKDIGLGGLSAAAVLPLGRGAKAVSELAQTPAEAEAHLLEAAAKAKAEGHGAHIGSKSNPPRVEKGIVTDATGGELGRQIREALPHAPEVRGIQKAGYSEELSARVKAATEAGLKAGGGTAGHLAEKGHLQGSLGREFFGHLKHLTPAQVDEAHRVIDKAPLQFFEKTHARDAITNAVDNGVAPTESEQALLERVFGKVGADEGQKPLTTAWQKLAGGLNIPRALRSSGDISFALRQGLTVLVTHPNLFRREFAKQIKAFGSEEVYQAQLKAIHEDPLYPLAVKYGVPFTDIGTTAKGVPIGKQEEAFVGANAAEKIPVVGKVVRASDRAFTGMSNGTRMELFKMMTKQAALIGRDLNEEDLGKSIARVVGTFTGRGTLPKGLEGHFTTMTAALFSPRLMASRLNMLSPVYYAKLDPFAREEALKGARNLVVAIGTTMYVAKLLGADVNFDPRSSNFTKIKLGNTRIDIAGGFSQYIRLIAQEMTRTAISSSGHTSHVGWGQGNISDLDNLTKFWRSKSAPVPGLLWDEGSGKDFIGQPVNQKHELWSNAPFVAQDTVDAYKQSGSKAAVVDAFLSSIGLGVQSYKDKPVGGGSGGGGSGFGGDGGSFGSGDNGFSDNSGGFGG